MSIEYYRQYEPLFGQWKIVEKIGAGSFGEVYRIERQDFNHTYTAALKAISIPKSKEELETVRDELPNEESVTTYFRSMVEDFIGELAMMSDLKGNSNIVSYEDHQVIPHKDDIGWDILIRMELLTPFPKYAKSKALTYEDVVRLGIDICKALGLCQKKNIYHRDIKPSNIFVNQNGDFKLGDFGVARIGSRTGSKSGTVDYMAPEVYFGRHFDHTIDTYSLGLVMYKLLNNGNLPFVTVNSYSVADNALKRRVSGEPLPVPVNSYGELTGIVLKACAYEPKDRFETPTQFRAALEALPSDNSIIPIQDDSIKPATWQPQKDSGTVSKWGRRKTKGIKKSENNSKVSILIGALIGIIVILIVLLVLNKENIEKNTAETCVTPEIIYVEVPATPAPTPTPRPTLVPTPGNIVPETDITLPQSNDGTFLPLLERMETEIYPKVSAGWVHSLYLDKRGGKVISTGSQEYRAYNLKNWTDIIDISDGVLHALGLKADGTVVAVGYNDCGQCDVSFLRNIVSIAAGRSHSVFLTQDGKVIAIGNDFDGRLNVDNWENIAAIAAGEAHTIGVKADGTVVATGYNHDGECNVEGWSDIVAVSGGSTHTVGLKKDGTVVAVGSNKYGQCDVSMWTDIVDISAGERHTLGLKSDGTVVACGSNEYGQCDVATWREIVSISAGSRHSIGGCLNGKVVAVGSNGNNQLDILP